MKRKNLTSRTAICLYLVLAVVTFTSCGNEPPVFNDLENPFIVGEISQKSKTHSIYYKNKMSSLGTSFFGSWYQAVVLPSGMYNVGDTINLVPNNR